MYIKVSQQWYWGHCWLLTGLSTMYTSITPRDLVLVCVICTIYRFNSPDKIPWARATHTGTDTRNVLRNILILSSVAPCRADESHRDIPPVILGDNLAKSVSLPSRGLVGRTFSPLWKRKRWLSLSHSSAFSHSHTVRGPHVCRYRYEVCVCVCVCVCVMNGWKCRLAVDVRALYGVGERNCLVGMQMDTCVIVWLFLEPIAGNGCQFQRLWSHICSNPILPPILSPVSTMYCL